MSILTMPDERLRQTSLVLDDVTDDVRELINRLTQSMEHGPGGVGIAAPQLGELVRLVIVDCSLAAHPCKNHGRLVMLNPEIIEKSGKVMGREGCLSVPSWVATVPRARKITVSYLDENGAAQELTTSNFEARVIQHEIDHLDGILFIDRVVSARDIVRRMAGGQSEPS